MEWGGGSLFMGHLPQDFGYCLVLQLLLLPSPQRNLFFIPHRLQSNFSLLGCVFVSQGQNSSMGPGFWWGLPAV